MTQPGQYQRFFPVGQQQSLITHQRMQTNRQGADGIHLFLHGDGKIGIHLFFEPSQVFLCAHTPIGDPLSDMFIQGDIGFVIHASPYGVG